MPQKPYAKQKLEAQHIAERVRWARELVSGTVTELAADLGVDTSTLRHIERGFRMPSLNMLMALCHVLRVSPQYLLWGSLEGVEPELAAKLKAAHPQLSWPSTPPARDNNHNLPHSSGAAPTIRGGRFYREMAG